MTDTPHLEALAMRTRAAEAMTPMLRSMISRGYAADLILALPLEADPAALVAEALRLPEISALVEASYLAGFNSSGEGYNGEYPFQDNSEDPEKDADWLAARSAALAALVQP